MTTQNQNQPWPADRLAELERLERLLNVIQTIPLGMSLSDYLNRLENDAENLTRHDMTAGRASFLAFLRTQAGIATGGER